MKLYEVEVIAKITIHGTTQVDIVTILRPIVKR